MTDNRNDPQGSHGGDTGNSTTKGKGPQAEKGDQRRDKPTSEPQTRNGKAGGIRGKHDDRSGSKSNAS